MNCPHCNKPVILAKPAMGEGWQQYTRHQLNTTAPAPWQKDAAPADYAGYDYQRRSPAREPNLQADVFVPAAQSLLTGVAIGVPTAAGLGLLGYTTGQALTGGAGLGLLTITGTWLIKLGIHNSLLWAIETVTGRDIDGDGETGEPEPEPEPEPVKLEVSHPTHTKEYHGLRFELPNGVTMGLFAAWANQVVNGIQTPARANWVGNGKPFSRGQYDNFLKALTKAGIIHDPGDGTGRQLTNGGRRALARMLQNTAGRRGEAGNAPTNSPMPAPGGEGGSYE